MEMTQDVIKLESWERVTGVHGRRPKAAWFSATAKRNDDGSWRVTLVADFVKTEDVLIIEHPMNTLIRMREGWMRNLEALGGVFG